MSVTEEDVAALVRDVAEAADAYMRGDMATYLTYIRAGDDHTLMPPYGGETVHGHDPTPEQIEITSQFFRNGEAQLEVLRTYTSGDMVVIVAIERQHGEVGGTPDQDWSLRVTLVFVRDGDGWRQVHRHADGLVHGITMELLGEIARGDHAPG